MLVVYHIINDVLTFTDLLISSSSAFIASGLLPIFILFVRRRGRVYWLGLEMKKAA